MNDQTRASLIDRARAALCEADNEQREKIYDALIADLEKMFGANDKEVAAELQRIAKAIEEQGEVDNAFTFKQRACEVLLRRNMMARRAQGRPPQAPIPPERTTLSGLKPISRLLQTLECICMPTSEVERDAEFYRVNVNADEVFSYSNGPRSIGLKVSSGPILLLIDAPQLVSCQPVYTADDADKILSELAKQNQTPAIAPVVCAHGTIYGFIDPSGNRFAVIDKKKRL